MAVKIRLTRIGKRNSPMYRIIAIDSRAKRDGKALEILGSYNPLSGKLVAFDAERIKYWVGVGAQLSETVKKLERMHRRDSQKESAQS